MASSWPDVLTGLIAGEDLGAETASWAMDEILAGNATDAQIAGFLVALRAKGETVEEIAGLAESMRDRATPITLDAEAVDVVGSGGDRANTVNVSTMAAVVAAAAGVPVVKHGNRAASSACGAADVLEALGVVLNVKPEDQPAVLAQAGIVFLFAPLYHPSLRHAATARRELGIQTPFNFLGPLANPARPAAQAVGIANLRIAALVAGVLARRGTRGLVFHGDDGLDELTTTTTSDVWLIRDGQVLVASLNPADLGFAPATPADLVGDDVAHNADVARRTLGGETGPVRDIVVLNAAAALLAFHGPDLDRDLTAQFAEQVAAASAAIDSGAASDVLRRWVDVTQRVAGTA
ncbi:MAG: anthranilate phosphoribosyltransferase [Micropruina sp.]|uniref:anthranilate phosphoribosyltransferase n=1 Tax=Micropruina sp. TaxID=2737536 RepID=UPI0039E2D628